MKAGETVSASSYAWLAYLVAISGYSFTSNSTDTIIAILCLTTVGIGATFIAETIAHQLHARIRSIIFIAGAATSMAIGMLLLTLVFKGVSTAVFLVSIASPLLHLYDTWQKHAEATKVLLGQSYIAAIPPHARIVQKFSKEPLVPTKLEEHLRALNGTSHDIVGVSVGAARLNVLANDAGLFVCVFTVDVRDPDGWRVALAQDCVLDGGYEYFRTDRGGQAFSSFDAGFVMGRDEMVRFACAFASEEVVLEGFVSEPASPSHLVLHGLDARPYDFV